MIPNGCDFPVEFVNPLISFHASDRAAGRARLAGGRLVPRAAHDARRGAQVACRSGRPTPAFQEKELGSLTAGKYADFVVLDQDIMRVPDGDGPRHARALHLGGRPCRVREEVSMMPSRAPLRHPRSRSSPA